MNPSEIGKEFIEHHGVKGQRWGVINKDKPTGKSAIQKQIDENPPKPLTPEGAAHVAASKKKFEAKFEESSGDSEKGWRPTKKQVAIGVGGAVLTAAVIYKVTRGKGADIPISREDYAKLARSMEAPDYLNGLSGKSISPSDFNGLVGAATPRVWAGSYIAASSFDQKPMSFSSGHQFFRLSSKPETGFNPVTFATHSEADLARYVASFGAPTHLITFKSNDEIRVPDLYTRLEAMRHTMREKGVRDLSPKNVMKEYDDRNGSGWNDPLSKAFINTLKKQGFHAIVDDMDAGLYGESPLVIIDPTRFGPKQAAKLADIGKEVLTKNLTEIKNRK